MGSLNMLSAIGMGFFILKFYIFIACKYAINSLIYLYERLRHGSSKTVICPYKNTHQHVFLSIGTPFPYSD